MRPLPVRIRLTIWYAVVFSLALAAFSLTLWILVRGRLYDELHDQLEGRIASVQRFLAAQKPDATSGELEQALLDEYETEDHAAWLQILNQDGRWMFRARGMEHTFPAATLPNGLPERGRLTTGRDGDFRVLMLEKAIRVQGRLYTVEAGGATNGIHHTLEQLRNVFLLLFPSFVIVAAAGGFYLSRRALRPVDEITSLARSIRESNLNRRLPSLKTKDELQRLSDTLNEMFARIEEAFIRTRQFTADASHELRTPVSLIRTEAELALRKTRTPEEYRAALEHILVESERTTELIESLLRLARGDSGADRAVLLPMQLQRFLSECESDWKPTLEQAELNLMLDVPSEQIFVSADERSLRRLMIVLLDNARKYTPPHGHIRIFAEADHDTVLVGVADDGDGMHPDELPHIFERFYRVDKARQRAQGGAGLGLSLAKWIAGQHATEIQVESSPQKGSTFTFRLKRASGNLVDAGILTEFNPQSVLRRTGES